MRRRAPKTSGPMSFFSFQDIVTAVSGIMLLVVLLLVIEVLHARSAAAPAPPPDPETAEALFLEVRQLQAERDRLAERLDAAERAAKESGALHLGEVPARLEALREENARQETEAEALERRAEEVQAELEALKEEAERLDLEIARAERRAVVRQAELDDLDAEKRVHFTFAERTDKTPVLVECSRAGIKAQAMDGRSAPRTFADPSDPTVQGAKRAFLAWARGRPAGRYAFIVLVKPSAAGYAMEVVDALRQAGFGVGHEPLEEDRTAVSAAGGAP